MKDRYRERIYNMYLTGSQISTIENFEDLKHRFPHLKKIIQYFPADRRVSVLDLGCGHGAIIWVARQMGYYNIRGVDSSPEQIAMARRLGIQGIRECDVMEALAEEGDALLDCVICFDLIEHFTKNEVLNLVDEVHRVLKPGGRWIIHTPNAESPFGMRVLYGDLTHESAFTRTSLSHLLISSGFSSVECFEDRPAIHGVKSAVRWGLWQAIRSLWRLYLAAETGDIGRDAIFTQNLLAVAFK